MRPHLVTQTMMMTGNRQEEEQEKKGGWAWRQLWHAGTVLVVPACLPALGRPREVDPESEGSFVCTARPCFKKQNRISVSVQFYSKHHDHKKVAVTFRGRIPSRPVRVTSHRAMATQGIQILENLVSRFIFYWALPHFKTICCLFCDFFNQYFDLSDCVENSMFNYSSLSIFNLIFQII